MTCLWALAELLGVRGERKVSARAAAAARRRCTRASPRLGLESLAAVASRSGAAARDLWSRVSGSSSGGVSDGTASAAAVAHAIGGDSRLWQAVAAASEESPEEYRGPAKVTGAWGQRSSRG